MESTLKKELPKIQDCLSEWCGGIIFPIKDLAEVLKKEIQKDPEFRLEIEQQSWSDTFTRDYIVAMVSKRFIKMEWPLNCDSKEYKDMFYKKLAQVMKTRKWKFKEE